MHKLQIKATWMLDGHPDGERLMPQLLPLLAEVHRGGSIASASDATRSSYRHAWGVIRRGGEVFGAPLVESVRGRGARLTALGERLLWTERRIAARLGPTLENFATELQAELDVALPDARPTLRIVASHAFAMTELREALARRQIPVTLSYRGSSEALAGLHHGECDVAGFHVPEGELQAKVLAAYAKWLRPASHVLVDLVERRQGIIVAADNPKHIASVHDLARPGVRFVNRQPGSGTRIVLDHLMQREGLEPSRIRGYDRLEYTHAAVAAFIASGMADAGLGVETAARQFHLGFVPLLAERYVLAMRRDALDSPMVAKLLAVMRSKEFRVQLVRLQGLDPARCGTVQEIREAFPAFPARIARAAMPRGAR